MLYIELSNIASWERLEVMQHVIWWC